MMQTVHDFESSMQDMQVKYEEVSSESVNDVQSVCSYSFENEREVNCTVSPR